MEASQNEERQVIGLSLDQMAVDIKSSLKKPNKKHETSYTGTVIAKFYNSLLGALVVNRNGTETENNAVYRVEGPIKQLFGKILLRNNQEALKRVEKVLANIDTPKITKDTIKKEADQLWINWKSKECAAIGEALENEVKELNSVINIGLPDRNTLEEEAKYIKSIENCARIISYNSGPGQTDIMKIFRQEDLRNIFPELDTKNEGKAINAAQKKEALEALREKVSKQGFFKVILNHEILSEVLYNTLGKNYSGKHSSSRRDKVIAYMKSINTIINSSETDESIENYVNTNFVRHKHGSYISRISAAISTPFEFLSESMYGTESTTGVTGGSSKKSKYLRIAIGILFLIWINFVWIGIFKIYFKQTEIHRMRV
ncbi:hypothetical protein NEAUS06_1838 [Nematocida ausubeli]|nr:hypothetical protein NEAUS06_1838 [Nematocida ausubeli]